VVSFILFANVRQKRHEPCLLDRSRKLPLMLRADIRMTGINDLCLARNEPAQKVDLLIIDVLHVL